jgi:PAS domain S-box-containing protein
VIDVNRSACEIYGYTCEELKRISLAELSSGEYPYTGEEAAKWLQKARAGGPVRIEWHRRNRDGSLHWDEVVLRPAVIAGQRRILASTREITERKQAEQALRQAQKMEALGQLTGGVAHDFNNLLMVITGNLEIASELATGVSGLERALARATVAAEIGADLTQRLLTFARRQPLQPQALDLNRLVHEMRDLLRRSLGEDVAIQLENAIINLAVNARDAMPDGGTLTIETANIYLDSDYARRNPGVTPGHYVLLEMTDNGTGMEPEVVDRAFEPFFTTKEVGRGSGLGLAMVYGFAKQSGGHAKIFSAAGHGTSLWLCLPRAAAEPASRAASRPWQLVRGDEKILVVEDNTAVREIVVTQLADLGYRVVSADDGPSALHLLQQDESIDLLFTDLVMPNGMSGRQLAEEAERLRPGMRVLFTSGYPNFASKQALELGPEAPLLRKPYKKKDLAERVRAALDRRLAAAGAAPGGARGSIRLLRPTPIGSRSGD